MRLNRFLAAAGLGSRRSCEELILSGQVTVNGVLCANLATQVEPGDVVKVGGRVVRTAPPATLLLHKLPGFVCTAADTHGRRTIFDLLPTNFPRLFHVGRLDKESEGLLIVTNDGELALKLTHPRYKVEKEYEVVLDKTFDFTLTEKLVHGIHTTEGWARAESAHKLGNNKVKITLRQGLKRQIRLMFYELGYEVTKLVRTRIGPIHLHGLPAGAWRVLTQKEIDSLVAAGAATAADASEPPNPGKTASLKNRRPAKPAAGSKRTRRPNSTRTMQKPDSAQSHSSQPGEKPRKSAQPQPKKFGGKPFGSQPGGKSAYSSHAPSRQSRPAQRASRSR